MGPASSCGRPAPTQADPFPWEWAGNWAAVLAIGLCLLVLLIWLSLREDKKEDEE